jgi:hypothetical protein
MSCGGGREKLAAWMNILAFVATIAWWAAYAGTLARAYRTITGPHGDDQAFQAAAAGVTALGTGAVGLTLLRLMAMLSRGLLPPWWRIASMFPSLAAMAAGGWLLYRFLAGLLQAAAH